MKTTDLEIEMSFVEKTSIDDRYPGEEKIRRNEWSASSWKTVLLTGNCESEETVDRLLQQR